MMFKLKLVQESRNYVKICHRLKKSYNFEILCNKTPLIMINSNRVSKRREKVKLKGEKKKGIFFKYSARALSQLQRIQQRKGEKP